MFVVTLSKTSLKKLGLGAMCCALVVGSALLGRFISNRTVAVSAAVNKIESAQDIQTWFTGYGLDVDGASITADKVKIPRKWDDSFSAFNGVVQQSGMDLARYKGKTVEKWTALIPAASSGETSRYGVLLVYRKKAVGAYLLERPSGVVVGLKDMQAAMAEAEAKQTSGEDYEGDWGERHDEELTGSEPAQQTSGEDYSGDWGERHDEELTAGCRAAGCALYGTAAGCRGISGGISTGTTCQSRKRPGTASGFDAKSGRNLPKICAQAEEKVKCVHFCHICMFNCTKILHKKLAI